MILSQCQFSHHISRNSTQPNLRLATCCLAEIKREIEAYCANRRDKHSRPIAASCNTSNSNTNSPTCTTPRIKPDKTIIADSNVNTNTDDKHLPNTPQPDLSFSNSSGSESISSSNTSHISRARRRQRLRAETASQTPSPSSIGRQSVQSLDIAAASDQTVTQYLETHAGRHAGQQHQLIFAKPPGPRIMLS